MDLTAPRITQVTIATTAAVPDPSYPIPAVATSGAQLLRVPVFQPNQVRITFDQDLADLAFAPGTLPALSGGDMQLFSLENGAPYALLSGVTYDPATRTATWSLTAPITGLDQIELSLFDTVADVAGNKLDAEGWIPPDSVFDTSGNSTYPSGDGAAGGSLTNFRITVMPGDVIGSGDNIINFSDFQLFQQNQGGGPNGDADFDGDVDNDDYNLILNNFQIDYRYWPTGGAAMASTGGARIDKETTLTGKPALRVALIDYYTRRTTDPDASTEFDSLLGWHMFGDKQWWNDLLGEGWESRLIGGSQ